MTSAEIQTLPAIAALETESTRALAMTSFDYAGLGEDDAERPRSAAIQIRSWRKQTIRVMIGTGVNLLAAKELLGHGRFSAWLQAEFGWADRTARSYMAAAEAFRDKTEIISDLPATVVYQLASPSMPPAGRAAVVSRLREDQRVPLDDIRGIIADAKEQDRVARAEAKKTAEQKAKEARDVARAKAAAVIVRRLTAEDLVELQSLMDGPGLYVYRTDFDHALRDMAAAGDAATTTAKPDMRAIEVAFEEEFWPAYPRKDDKGRARKAFLTVIKSKTATVSDLVNGAMRYAAERQGEDPKFTKQPATWLNAEAWLNEASPAAPAASRMQAGQPQSRSQSAMAGILSYSLTQEAPYVDGPFIEG